jgi:hypothetical protein
LDDKYYEWKKVKSIMDLLAVCDQVKQQVSSSKASPSAQKGSFREVSLSDKYHHRLYKELCGMEMPFVDNGNMKHFHKAFMNYFPSLLLFKEKYGHLLIPGDDPKREWPGLQQWL